MSQDDLNRLAQLISTVENDPENEAIHARIEDVIDDLRMNGTRCQRFRQLQRKYVQIKRRDIPLDIIEHGRNVQKESEKKLHSIVRVTNETKDLATMTSQELAQHMEQIARMHDVLDEIEPTLVRANRHIKRMTRAVVCNKYLWILIFFILVGIGAIIYLKH